MSDPPRSTILWKYELTSVRPSEKEVLDPMGFSSFDLWGLSYYLENYFTSKFPTLKELVFAREKRFGAKRILY